MLLRDEDEKGAILFHSVIYNSEGRVQVSREVAYRLESKFSVIRNLDALQTFK